MMQVSLTNGLKREKWIHVTHPEPIFKAKLAASPDEFRAAQRLRYDIFVKELGGNGEMVDHENRLERDIYDSYCDHLLLYDEARDAQNGSDVVGVYRILTSDQAEELGRFYSEDEYDLGVLKSSGRKLMELGRSCLHPEYRGGSAMLHLWQALSHYVNERDIEILFGVASFHGTQIDAHKEPLSLLHHNHLAPRELRVVVKHPHNQPMDLIDPDEIDKKRAILAVPALIKAYLRLGGFVGEGAFVDRAFNTTDVCLVLDTKKLSARQKKIYRQRAFK